jgi:uncharacterized membrane protein YesL
MMWAIIKNSASDIWDEMFYLIIFNFISVVGALLVLPLPWVIFGLYFTVYDIGESKGIKLGTFFHHARRIWKQALLWGGINLGIWVIWWVNVDFYGRIGTQWATIAQMFTIALAIFWGILQLVALAFYPRLINPGFKLAQRNALISIGRYPHFVFVLLVLIVLILVVTYFVPVLLFLGAFAMIVVVANRVVDAMVKKEKLRQTGEVES